MLQVECPECQKVIDNPVHIYKTLKKAICTDCKLEFRFSNSIQMEKDTKIKNEITLIHKFFVILSLVLEFESWTYYFHDRFKFSHLFFDLVTYAWMGIVFIMTIMKSKKPKEVAILSTDQNQSYKNEIKAKRQSSLKEKYKKNSLYFQYHVLFDSRKFAFGLIFTFLLLSISTQGLSKLLSINIYYGYGLTLAMLFCSVYLIYPNLVAIINTNKIQITKETITLKTSPLPLWGFNQKVAISNIEQLYIIAFASDQKLDGIGTHYQINYVSRSGIGKVLFPYLKSYEEALRIEQSIEKFLNIEDRPVSEEHIPIIFQHSIFK